MSRLMTGPYRGPGYAGKFDFNRGGRDLGSFARSARGGKGAGGKGGQPRQPQPTGRAGPSPSHGTAFAPVLSENRRWNPQQPRGDKTDFDGGYGRGGSGMLAHYASPLGGLQTGQPPPGGGGPFTPPGGFTGGGFGGGGSRGLLGQVEDAYRKPLDFSGMQPVRVPDGSSLPYIRGTNFGPLPDIQTPDFSNLQGVTTGKTPLIRNRRELATRLEGMYGDYQGAFGDYRGAFDDYRGAYDRYRNAHADIDQRYGLAGPDSYTADRNAVERAVYDRAYNRLQPELDRQEQRIRTDLANRGLAPTSEAYGDLYGQFADRRQRDLNDLSLAAVLAGSQEHQRLADLTSRNRAQLFGEQGNLFAGAGNVYQGAGNVYQGAGSLYQGGLANVHGIEGFNKAEEAERARVAQRQLALRRQQAAEAQAAAEAANRARQQLFGEDLQRGQAHFGQDLATRQQLAGEGNQRFAQQSHLRQQQINEALLKRGQPTRDLAGLIGATSGVPQMPQYAQYSAPAGDLMGLAGSNYAAQQNRRGANKGGALGALGSLGGAAISSGLFSDRRLKENIRRIGTAENGLPIYAFEYNGSCRTQLGFMADEVEKVHPEAVSELGGFKLVDYAQAVEPVAEAA